MLEFELKNLKLENPLATLEPIREKFKQANTARNRFLAANPEEKRIIASEVLWNLSVRKGNIEEVRYRSYFEVMAKSPKKGDLAMMLAF